MVALSGAPPTFLLNITVLTVLLNRHVQLLIANIVPALELVYCCYCFLDSL